MQVLASAVDALAPAQRGQVGRWPAAWSGSEGFRSPAEELILSMQSPHAQVRSLQGTMAAACNLYSSVLENYCAASVMILQMAPHCESPNIC